MKKMLIIIMIVALETITCGGTDCNDNNADVNPGALESCNSLVEDGFSDWLAPTYSEFQIDNILGFSTHYAYILQQTVNEQISLL